MITFTVSPFCQKPKFMRAESRVQSIIDILNVYSVDIVASSKVMGSVLLLSTDVDICRLISRVTGAARQVGLVTRLVAST